MFFGRIVAALAVVAAGVQAQLQVQTPAAIQQCVPVAITFSGGTAPYFLSIIPGGQTGAAALVDFGTVSASPYTWTDSTVASGTSITIKLTDSTGTTVYSAPVTIQAGSTSCTSSSAASSQSTTATAVISGSTTTAVASTASSAAVSSILSSASSVAASNSAAGSSSSSLPSVASSTSAASSTSRASTSAAASSVASSSSAAASSAAATTSAASGAMATGVAHALWPVAAGVLAGAAALL